MSTPAQSPELSAIFDRVVCINLKRRPDRWQAFQDRLSQTEWPFRQVEKYIAVDGDRVTAPAWIQCGNGGWGCLRSHMRIFEDALQDNITSLLILEDDASFCPDFSTRIQMFFEHLPKDWDGLLLGGQHLARPHAIADGVVQVRNGNRTHAHAYRGHYIRKVYRFLCDYPSHAETPTFHIDHRLGALHISGDYKIYAPDPWLIGQSSGSSDISGRNEEERFWDDRSPAREIRMPPQRPSLREKAEKIPIIAILGIYRSGGRVVAGILEELGVYLGEQPNWHKEDEEIQELCRNFFKEPELTELVPSKNRIYLLQWWASRQRYNCVGQFSMIAAKHPLLAMMGADLLNAWGPDTKFITINRQFDDAVASLEKMPWGYFRENSRASQLRLHTALQDFSSKQENLCLDYDKLLNSPFSSVQQIAQYLNLSVDESAIHRAVATIECEPSSRE